MKTNRRHNLTLSKSRGRKRGLRGSQILTRRDEKHLKKALPYGLPK
jgi:ribosomal protein L35